MEKYTQVKNVKRGSIAHLAGIRNGDVLLTINGTEPMDILEYKYLISDEQLELEVLKKDQTVEVIDVDNPNYKDLGITFRYPLLSKAKTCRNKCIFCFIDQLPKDMRKTLYFKDDDYRLSFLQGNYVTLTNLSEEVLSKITEMRISPINISVHTTNPELRAYMLRNKNAGNILEIMKRLCSANIVMNCQIVLCRGINDGEELDKTISDLITMHPHVNSISVVPVGLSDHRGGLFHLESFDRETAKSALEKIEYWQWRMLKTHKKRLVFAADELYLKAGVPIPPYEDYEDFPQIENGVGLIASLRDELDDALSQEDSINVYKNISIATGVAAYDFILECANKIMNKYKNIKINVYPINNTFFGNNVTVAGLVCGKDLISTLKNKDLGDKLLLPSVMFRADGDIMLDDVPIEEIETSLGISISLVQNDGYELLEAIIN